MQLCAGSAPAHLRFSLPRVGSNNREPTHAQSQATRDFYTDWELWEMDGKLHVQLTGADWMRAIERGKEAERLVAEGLERAKAQARRNRRDGEVR
jgi:hypothetical protein